VLIAVLVTSCGPASSMLCPGQECPGCPGPDCGEPPGKEDYGYGYSLNPAAGTAVLYEVQVRSANACHPEVGSQGQRQACLAKVAPEIPYYGPGCSELSELKKIRLGTLDDMLQNTVDYRQGITLRYIKEKVGANTIWLMPLFPNNFQYDLPDPCDDLGSPYAVRDYLHVRSSLAAGCIVAGRDEYTEPPCFGNQELEQLIKTAHSMGLKVILDVAFNHFGHNYVMYDLMEFTPIRERIARGENLGALWDFAASEERALLYPEILDTPEELQWLAEHDVGQARNLAALRERCPDLDGQALVVAYNMWREALDWEREKFPCDTVFLEYALPGFYMGANRWDPSGGLGDNFSNNWRDVKFLFHQRLNQAHQWEFVRNREYLFRVLNYWVSRGVDGFRLDHATDADSGISAEEWDYILSKVNYYAQRRGQPRPIYLAEEFHDQMSMSRVVDIMTEGYVRDMTGRGGVVKDAGRVEWIIANTDRFQGQTYVMTALETHDELRLTEGTGFNVWTGAGFWAIGAATWSTPMLLMGQEFGEPYGLGFRRSDFLRGRFEGTSNYHPQGAELTEFYRKAISSRLEWRNRALYSSPRHFLRSKSSNSVDPSIFAQVKWSGDGNVVFVFHNLWEQEVTQSYYIPPDVGQTLWIRDDRRYRLVNVMSGQATGPCRSGADLKWEIYVHMPAHERLQWLRLEACD